MNKIYQASAVVILTLGVSYFLFIAPDTESSNSMAREAPTIAEKPSLSSQEPTNIVEKKSDQTENSRQLKQEDLLLAIEPRKADELFNMSDALRNAPRQDLSARLDVISGVLACVDYEKNRQGVSKSMADSQIDPKTRASFIKNFEMLGRSCQTLSAEDYRVANEMIVSSALNGERGFAAIAYNRQLLNKSSDNWSKAVAQIFTDASQGDRLSMTLAATIEPPAGYDRVKLLAIKIASFIRGKGRMEITMEFATALSKQEVGGSFSDDETAQAIKLAEQLLRSTDSSDATPKRHTP